MAYNTEYWENEMRKLENQYGTLESAMIVLLKSLKKQADGSYTLDSFYEMEVNDAKRLVGIG